MTAGFCQHEKCRMFAVAETQEGTRFCSKHFEALHDEQRMMEQQAKAFQHTPPKAAHAGEGGPVTHRDN